MDGFGNVLDEFERDADFELLGVDGITRACIGDEFERHQRGQLRENVGGRRDTLVHDRVKDGHQSVNGKRLRP